MIDESDLPDEMQSKPGGARPAPDRQDGATRLVQLGIVIAKKREEAKNGRRESGVEDTWTACEMAYEGIDEANAHLFGKSKWAKPTSPTGPVTRQDSKVDDTKSTVFIPLTARYVDTATAMVSEIILPIDGRPFSIKSPPVPDLIIAAADARQVVDNGAGGTGAALERPPTDDEAQQLQQQAQANGGQQAPASVPLTVKDLAQEKLDAANDKAKKAEDRMAGWMIEAKYPMQMRKVVFDSARIGVGVLKAPFPTQRKKRAVSVKGNVYTVEYLRKTSPDMKWVDPWNCFPDPSCGEDIQDGDYFFERDFITEGKLRALKNEKTSKGTPIYLSAQIDKVIEEGPEKANVTEQGDANRTARKKRYTIWYFTGVLTREDLQAAGTVGLDDLPDEVVECSAIVTVVNDTVIRAALSPLDSGSLGYRAVPWARRPGSWTGKGVAEQVDVGQRITNNGTRRMLENAGKSAGVQFIIDDTSIYPADGVMAITPDKIWIKAPDATMDDVRKAFLSVVIANVTDQLMKIVEYGMKLCEEASNIPLVTQGRDGETTPETLGQAELQNNNAHAVLRAKAYAIDDCVTEPVVNELYDWLLMDPDVPDDEKGEFEIDAHGSIVLVERAIQEAFLGSQANIVTNPVFGINPKKWYAAVLKSKRQDIKDIEYTPQEAADMAKQPPPEDPRVTAAKINAKGRTDAEQMRVDRDTQFAHAEQQKNELDHEGRLQELAVKRELAMLEYATQERISLNEVKAQLADTSMRLQEQAKLSTDNLVADLHKHHSSLASGQVITPPTEPAGRAENGQAFAQ